eukprot:14753490-Ditylum_brightwellii.AAC.1
MHGVMVYLYGAIRVQPVAQLGINGRYLRFIKNEKDNVFNFNRLNAVLDVQKLPAVNATSSALDGKKVCTKPSRNSGIVLELKQMISNICSTRH